MNILMQYTNIRPPLVFTFHHADVWCWPKAVMLCGWEVNCR